VCTRPIRRLFAVVRPQPSRDRLALLAGLAASIVLASAVAGTARLAHGLGRAAPAAGSAPLSGRTAPVVATAGDVASLRRIRQIARSQLRISQRRLRTCPGRADIADSAESLRTWTRCATWPLAHLGMDGRTDGGILSAIGQHLPAGGCREVVLGRAGEMRLLGAEAEGVVRGRWDATPAGRSETARDAESVLGLIGYLRRAWRESPLATCRPVL
jgi:hypothetical protein